MEKNSNQLIPIYRFEPKTRLYCGTDVAQYINGKPNLPPDTTLIKPNTPPPNYVCVWDAKKEQWTHERREKYNLSNYEVFYGIYHRYDTKTFNTPTIFPTEKYLYLGDPNVQALFAFYGRLNGFERYSTPFSGTMVLYNRLRFLNQRLSELYNGYPDLSNPHSITEQFWPSSPTDDFNRRYEEIIYQMKRVIDILIMVAYIGEALQGKLADAKFEIKFQSIGQLLHCSESNLTKSIKKTLAFAHFTDFYTWLNAAHNGFKHEILCEYSNLEVHTHPFIDLTKIQTGKTLENLGIYRCNFDFIVNAFRDVLSEVILGEPQASVFVIHRTKAPLPCNLTAEELILKRYPDRIPSQAKPLK